MTTDYSKLSREDLLAKIEAQQKTIEVLMDDCEERAGKGFSSLSLLSENLNLERIVEQKTKTLLQQGIELEEALQDLKATQSQLLQANKLESVGQLAAGIAHEINTPAQFVGTNIEFLREAFVDIQTFMRELTTLIESLTKQEREKSQEQLTDSIEDLDWEYLKEEIPAAIEQSQDGIKRISSIVMAMKEFSHPSSKEMEPHNINTIIERTVTVSRNEWKYCAELETRFDNNLPKINCLVDELGQVILNIIINAAHAINEKEEADQDDSLGKIEIATYTIETDVIISIKDSGCGIAEEIQSKIFDPFFTTKSLGKGTGQGLAIAHDIIVNKHHGKITCNSTKGIGTQFKIVLPVV